MSNSTMPHGHIYALASTREPKHFRYVGQTRKLLNERLHGHIRSSRAKRHADSTFYTWIRTELLDGYNIRVIELQSADSDDDLNLYEDLWIQNLRVQGHVLLNTKPGGGYRGTEPHSEATRALLSNLTRLQMQSPEMRDAARRGGKMSGVHGAKYFVSDAGREAARRGADSVHEWMRTTPEGRVAQQKFASAGSHTRWHVNRGIIKEGCELCEGPS